MQKQPIARGKGRCLSARAVVFEEPRDLTLRELRLTPPAAGQVVVDVDWTGISTGTEKLLYSGSMPPFPGLGYPLVPGYETVGRVREAGPDSGLEAGQPVFVSGARCYGEIRGLFGGAASCVVADAGRVLPVGDTLGADATLLALAATAHHALAPGGQAALPGLIIGHGVLGRLLARLCVALGGEPPVVWETAAARRSGGEGYSVVDPADDATRAYARILDASGDASIIDTLIARLEPRGELVLAGFYAAPIAFDFPPAFMREARLSIAAEWTPGDLAAVSRLIADGRLSLAGLITHRLPAADAACAYTQAFTDDECLKMVLDWRE